MVVRFVRDDDAVTLAVVNAEMQDARVFARAQHDARAAGRQPFEVMAARLIAAMLAPLRVERVQLDDRGLAPEPFARFAQLVVAQRDVRSSGDAGTNQARLPCGTGDLLLQRRVGVKHATNARWPASRACGHRAPYLRARGASRTAWSAACVSLRPSSTGADELASSIERSSSFSPTATTIRRAKLASSCCISCST